MLCSETGDDLPSRNRCPLCPTKCSEDEAILTCSTSTSSHSVWDNGPKLCACPLLGVCNRVPLGDEDILVMATPSLSTATHDQVIEGPITRSRAKKLQQ
ncbi:hypothetical protein C2845_PM05G19430 [Panicum miliaceum]|uniref:Uncharacterized protein n=1 Tax=Panicum miliaceum TaxID=4540 RepID=A0A3L6T4R4_PANMI|nr:hypothetical protein C2845_PM05G19430 [Panicum miliaceum]